MESSELITLTSQEIYQKYIEPNNDTQKQIIDIQNHNDFKCVLSNTNKIKEICELSQNRNFYFKLSQIFCPNFEEFLFLAENIKFIRHNKYATLESLLVNVLFPLTLSENKSQIICQKYWEKLYCIFLDEQWQWYTNPCTNIQTRKILLKNIFKHLNEEKTHKILYAQINFIFANFNVAYFVRNIRSQSPHHPTISLLTYFYQCYDNRDITIYMNFLKKRIVLSDTEQIKNLFYFAVMRRKIKIINFLAKLYPQYLRYIDTTIIEKLFKKDIFIKFNGVDVNFVEQEYRKPLGATNKKLLQTILNLVS